MFSKSIYQHQVLRKELDAGNWSKYIKQFLDDTLIPWNSPNRASDLHWVRLESYLNRFPVVFMSHAILYTSAKIGSGGVNLSYQSSRRVCKGSTSWICLHSLTCADNTPMQSYQPWYTFYRLSIARYAASDNQWPPPIQASTVWNFICDYRTFFRWCSISYHFVFRRHHT